MKVTLIRFLYFFLLSISIISCRDDLDYASASKPLRFSKDTLLLDTVFTAQRSETYLLKVYNQENEDITIPEIYLEKGVGSQFKINVDGYPGTASNNNTFNNVPLRKKDSLYIFIEIAPENISGSEALTEENLIFITRGAVQKVKLISLVENAVLYYSDTGTKEITSDLVWDNTTSKVVYGELKFTNNSKLLIEEGSRVYLHKGARIIFDEGSELTINGTLGKEVTIRGDRHSIKYDSLPGVWKQIYLAPNTTATINYANIKGGTDALYLEKGAVLNISNSKIFNSSNSGINSIGGVVTGKNIVMNNSGTANLLAQQGGTYNFTHSTFANYWNLTSSSGYAVSLSNNYDLPDGIVYGPLNATFNNCVFWVKNNNSLTFEKNTFTQFNYSFNSNLIKNNSKDIIIETDPNFVNSIINQDPLFYKTKYSDSQLNLKPGSPAFGKGNINFANTVPIDIQGASRTLNPTLGAYQN